MVGNPKVCSRDQCPQGQTKHHENRGNRFSDQKIEGFDQIQAEIISDRIIQKITKQFANHLKSNEVDTEDSLELIQKVFQLELHSK